MGTPTCAGIAAARLEHAARLREKKKLTVKAMKSDLYFKCGLGDAVKRGGEKVDGNWQYQ